MMRLVLLWPTVLIFTAVLILQIAGAQQRSVLLITIDTLRADYLSCNGSTRVQTPVLDSLAKRGINFVRARSAVPLTLPSHASILTALYPPSHGVRDNGRFRLTDSYETLAEVFRKKGYNTAAFVGSFVLDKRFGLAQGFDHYDDDVITDTANLESPEAERNADSVLRAFSNWYQKADSKRPFFAWVHFYDPHAPYQAPSAYAAKYPQNPYAAEAAYTDAVIGRLLKQLQPRQNLVIAVVGDHGEGLGEHQESTHSILIYNSTLHVPMILCAPGLLPQGIKISTLTRTIDLAPTLLDYLSIPGKFGEGVSLRPLIQDKQIPGLIAYSESLYPKLNLGWSELRGIEDDRFHYIQAPEPELYDLDQDPDEKHNKISELPKVAEKLRAELSHRMDNQIMNTQTMDPETTEKLKSLGYVASTPPKSTNQVDPKKKMAVWEQIQKAMADFHQGNFADASRKLERLLSTDSEVYLVYEYLSSSYIKQGKWIEAEKTILRAEQHRWKTANLKAHLGVIRYQRGDYRDAEAAFREAIDLDSFHVTAMYYLGLIYRAQKKPEMALESFQRALKISPRYTLAWNAIGMTYSSVGRPEDALKAFQQAVKLDPQNPQGHYNLAVQLEQMKRNKDALDHFRTFLKLAPTTGFAEQRKRALAAVERLQ